jgi:hypothetical protein
MLDVMGVAWGNPPMFGPASDCRPLQGFLIGGFTISLQKGFREKSCPQGQGMSHRESSARLQWHMTWRKICWIWPELS